MTSPFIRLAISGVAGFLLGGSIMAGFARPAIADEFFPLFEALQITEREDDGPLPAMPTEDNYVAIEIRNQTGIGTLSGYTVLNCQENDSVWRILRAFSRRESQSAQLTLTVTDYDGNQVVENLPFLHVTYTDVRSNDRDNCVSGLIAGKVTPIFPVRRNARFTLKLGISKTDSVDVTLLSGIQRLAAGARDIFGVGGWAGKVLATDHSLELLEDLQDSFDNRFGVRAQAVETFPLDSDDVRTIVRASLYASPSQQEIYDSIGSVDIRLSYLESLFFDRDDHKIGRGSDVLDRPVFAETDKTIRAKLLNQNNSMRVHASDIAIDLSDPRAEVDFRDLCNTLRSELRGRLKLSRRDTTIAMWSVLEEMTEGVRFAAAPHAHDDACFSKAELKQLREHNETWTLAEPREDFSDRDVGARMDELERAIFSGQAADPEFLKTLATQQPSTFFVRITGQAFGESQDSFLTGDAAFRKAAEILGTRVARIGCYAPSELSSLGTIAFHAASGTDFSGPTANAVLFDTSGKIRGFDFATDVTLIKTLHGFIDWPAKTGERRQSCSRFQVAT